MQRLFKDVLDQRFDLSVDIINGDTRGSEQRGGSKANRRQILERFRTQAGFAVLVLSPVVAGLGLTLVEANHVIHYGRWWNPALEAQATDRAHCIGQTKPVHVYYPIAVDPLKQFSCFDEKLDRIISGGAKLPRISSRHCQPTEKLKPNCSTISSARKSDV